MPATISIFRYNNDSCEFEELGGEEGEKIRDQVRNYKFDQNLQPYPIHKEEEWKKITSHVTEETLLWIQGASGIVYSQIEEWMSSSDPSTLTEDSLDRSKVFDRLVATFSRPREILGELECAYSMFFLGE